MKSPAASSKKASAAPTLLKSLKSCWTIPSSLAITTTYILYIRSVYAMPVPWEALIPFGLLTVMFGVTGTGFSIAKRMTNDGKPPRYNLDSWEHMMMARDERLTGSWRGQRSEPVAPASFATNSVWGTEKIN